MKLYKIPIFFFAIILLYSCNREDIIDKEFNYSDPIDIQYFKRSSVSGRITDEFNLPLANTDIKYNNNITHSDSEGYFQIKNEPLREDGELLTITSQNHFTQYAIIEPQLNKVTQLNIIQQKKENGRIINPRIEIDEEFYQSQIKCNISKDNFIDKNGEEYKDNISMYIKSPFLNPEHQSYSPTFGIPKSNTGIGPDSIETIVFPIFSMLIKFESLNNKPLFLKNSMDVLIQLNCVPCITGSDLYLWKFDISTGKWIAKNKVVLDLSNNTIELSTKESGYFIIAEYDVPLISIEGTITYEDGTAANSIPIELINNDLNISISYTFTNYEGRFFAFIEQNTDLTIRLYNCEGNINIIPLGKINSSIIKEIILPQGFNNTFNIQINSIYNDIGNIVNKAFLEISDITQISYIPYFQDSTGIDLNIHSCFPIVTLYDLDDLPFIKNSEPITLANTANINFEEYPTIYETNEFIYAEIDTTKEIFNTNIWYDYDGQNHIIGIWENDMELIIKFHKEVGTNTYIGQIGYLKIINNFEYELYQSSDNNPVIFDITENTFSISGHYSDVILYNGNYKIIEGYFKFNKY